MRKIVLFLLILLASLGCMTTSAVVSSAEAIASVSPAPRMRDLESEAPIVELQEVVRLPIEFVVCTDVLHVRSNPFVAEGNVVGWLRRGEVVLVHEMFEGWGRLAGLDFESVRWVKLEFLCRIAP